MFANVKKCKFGQTSLEYLGHIISNQGVATNDTKIQVMLDWPVPLSVKDLRGISGLTGYYRHFVANYGSIAWPLIELLKKDNFKWEPQADAAFLALKTAISRCPILALPNFSRPFIGETDASCIGIGAMLLQDEGPLAFFNQALPKHARLKSVYEHKQIYSSHRSWFKVAVSITDSDGPETYRSRCIDQISVDTQNKMIFMLKNY